MILLSEIQKKLKVPKSHFNKFGNYKYRSAEDILEAVKPLLGEACLTITDEVVLIGDRHYVKSTAKLQHKDTFVEVSAYAREAQERKGMSEDQLTGAASSYARKYALNGLLCIDDTKTSDDIEPEDEPKPKVKSKDLIEEAFMAYQEAHIGDIKEGHVFDMGKFKTQIIKVFKRLPTRKDSIPKIIEKIKPEDVSTEMKNGSSS
jgi:hypothetical protein